jgi:hypothetical protein
MRIPSAIVHITLFLMLFFLVSINFSVSNNIEDLCAPCARWNQARHSSLHKTVYVSAFAIEPFRGWWNVQDIRNRLAATRGKELGRVVIDLP